MTIDWAAFTPWSSLGGGMLIGAAAAWLMLGAGRIAGISGILAGLLPPRAGAAWRMWFLAGLLAAPWLYRVFEPMPAVRIEAGALQLVLAGLLVGVGTRYGSGCTSGHGVCGLARGSRRSLAAVLAFMATGFATVFVLRHLMGA
ncbi:YeeE/YedE family protein [Bordetella bronchiseptica]|uniref:YeeE/YedE family protein n=1 Tax=Bordetella bronchiseptica TaxID=518 RepID=UPI00028BA7A8|nr:membrane protein [Bordetella bronchiseptica]KCV35921.1 sulfur transport [Bordetella bronchiseptica 00-P-2730]KDD60014.1 sulfur transport [Bordetella bronchiseptica OSU553]AUL13575.1 YeeE/YedE [Bordetella bronchiseptica]AWP56664.1 YeeE/YedE [Bordetella bronchiseptica]AWQ03389.1 YeeE/YedE [Bordetella bronchiseptica]